MKLFNLIALIVLCSSNISLASITNTEIHEFEYLMSYPSCLPINYDYCPAEFEFCYMDLEQYIEFMGNSHDFDSRVTRLRRFELEAIQIIAAPDRIGKRPYDIVRTDCGAHGLFHFQPPEGILEWSPWDASSVIQAAGSCPYYTRQWVNLVDLTLHIYPYGAGYQLLEWRDRVLAAAYYARDAGWPSERLSWALAIANSTGVSGFRRILREDPEKTLDLYVAQRPESNHRQQRANMLRAL